MKNLQDYIINEMRLKDKFKMIPFDLFKSYIETSIVDQQYDDCEEYYEVLQVFVDNMGTTPECLQYFKAFVAWTEQYMEMKSKKGTTIEEFYEMFGNMKWENMKRVVGAGSFGVVFGKDDDKVIKLFYSKMTPSDKTFYEACLKHPDLKVFPKVYRYGDRWVMMEKLDVNTPKVEKYNEYLFRLADEEVHEFDGHVLSDYITQLVQDPGSIPLEFLEAVHQDKMAQEIWDWLGEVKDACKKVGPKLKMENFDWHPGNFGERENGEIVFFDI